MATHSVGAMQGAGNANRKLVRLFSVALSGLVWVYVLLAVRMFIGGSAFAIADWMLVAGKVALGAAALIVLLNPAWFAERLERAIDEMGALFRSRLRQYGHIRENPDDRAGDDGQPPA